uniref:Mitochondrial carrier 1 n=1 Tax=Rousettus aegyptiacus TaxID=9407 RepID=A0A7J8KCR6_ROUAE|nr:mitochondrial carrier 1 [Rousettus aegyptiacus]
MAGAGAGAGARGGAAAGVEARARDPPPAHRAHPRHPRPAAQPSARRMDSASGGLGCGDNAPTTEALFVALGAGVTALSHPLLYVKLLIQVGHEPMPPTIGTNVLSSIGKIFKEEGLLGFFVGLIPHLLGDVVFLWGCNLLAHFINAYLVDDSFSQALAIRSYTKFVMGIAVSMLTYPFLLVGDLMAVNNCGLQAGLPPYSPVFKSWIHCWKYLSVQGQLFRGSSLLFRRVSSGSCFALE